MTELQALHPIVQALIALSAAGITAVIAAAAGFALHVASIAFETEGKL